MLTGRYFVAGMWNPLSVDAVCELRSSPRRSVTAFCVTTESAMALKPVRALLRLRVHLCHNTISYHLRTYLYDFQYRFLWFTCCLYNFQNNVLWFTRSFVRYTSSFILLQLRVTPHWGAAANWRFIPRRSWCTTAAATISATQAQGRRYVGSC